MIWRSRLLSDKDLITNSGHYIIPSFFLQLLFVNSISYIFRQERWLDTGTTSSWQPPGGDRCARVGRAGHDGEDDQHCHGSKTETWSAGGRSSVRRDRDEPGPRSSAQCQDAGSGHSWGHHLVGTGVIQHDDIADNQRWSLYWPTTSIISCDL